MIVEQTVGTYPSADAAYYGFGNMNSYLSGPTEPPPSVASSGDKQFIGEIQQLGLGAILDASMGIT